MRIITKGRLDILKLYKGLLRSASLFFDDVARDFLRNRIRRSFRLNKNLEKGSADARRKIAEARRNLRRLQRVEKPPYDVKVVENILNQAYGRSGPRRHQLMQDYLKAPDSSEKIEWPHKGTLPSHPKPLLSLIRHNWREYQPPKLRLAGIKSSELMDTKATVAKKFETDMLNLYHLAGRMGGKNATLGAKALLGVTASVERNLRWRSHSQALKKLQMPLSPGGDKWTKSKESLIDLVERKAGKNRTPEYCISSQLRSLEPRNWEENAEQRKIERYKTRSFQRLLTNVPIIVREEAKGFDSMPQLGYDMKFTTSKWIKRPLASVNEIDRLGVNSEDLDKKKRTPQKKP